MKKIKYIVLIDDDGPTNLFHKIIIDDSQLVEEYQFFDSAITALEVLKKSSKVPDFILLDINMPKMDGWEFLDMYKNFTKENIAPTIIMLTTSLSALDTKKAEQMPLVKDFMQKPLDIEKLKHLIDLIG